MQLTQELGDLNNMTHLCKNPYVDLLAVCLKTFYLPAIFSQTP